MRSSALALAALISLAFTVQASAADWGDVQDDPAYDASKAICRAVKDAQPPPGDLPTPAQSSALKGCDAEALYYGQKAAPDYPKARQCAFVATRNGQVDTDQVFGGLAILAQVYANGLGAAKNLDLATHYACNLAGAPAEMDGRVTHLAAIKAKGPGQDRFDYCDDITSGFAQGQCASREQTLANARREAGLDALGARVAPAARGAYAALRRRSDAFATLHGGNEIDLSGTARGALVIEAEEEAREAFGKTLRRLLDGKLASATPAQAKSADAALNAAWRRLRAHGQKVQAYGTVTLDDVVKAQRAWLGYRDAFAAFDRAQAPGASSDGLLVELTQARTAALQDLLR